MKKSINTLATAMGCLALATASVNAELLTTADGLSATASTQLTGDYSPTKAIDGTGLTGNQHNTNNRSGWLSSSVSGATADQYIQFDLGDSYVLSSIQVWNYNQGGYTGNGIDQLDIYFSASATDPGDPEGGGSANWSLWKENATFAVAPGSTSYTGFDLATATGVATTLPTTAVRWVRFEVDSAFTSPAPSAAFPHSVGISEIQFTTAVPEPSAATLLGLAGLVLMLRRRRS